MKKFSPEKELETVLPSEAAPLCGAKTRAGTPCLEPRIRCSDGSYRPRCFAHGCAPGSGAPKGNQNAVKHGYFRAEAVKQRQYMRDILNDYLTFLQQEAVNVSCEEDI